MLEKHCLGESKKPLRLLCHGLVWYFSPCATRWSSQGHQEIYWHDKEQVKGILILLSSAHGKMGAVTLYKVALTRCPPVLWLFLLSVMCKKKVKLTGRWQPHKSSTVNKWFKLVREVKNKSKSVWLLSQRKKATKVITWKCLLKKGKVLTTLCFGILVHA